VSDGELNEAASDTAAPDSGVFEQEDAARTDRVLAEALDALDGDDRLLLRLRFQQELQVAQIARLTGLDQKALYRRIESLMKRLRRDLEARGVSASGVTSIIGRPDVNFTALDVDRLETTTKGPSLR
jgi:DNA-directed RNA polymerase specialized sigma subunit